MKQLKQEHNSDVLGIGGGSGSPALTEMRTVRLAKKATNQRVEELKMRLFRVTEQHMDQAVSLIRRWMDEKAKK